MPPTPHAPRLRRGAYSGVPAPAAAFVAALAAFAAPAAPAVHAQTTEAPPPLARYAPVGTRVRVTAPPLGGAPRTAEVVAWRGDTLLVRPTAARDPVAVAPSALRDLEVSFGRRRRVGRGTLYGLAVGLPLGTLVGAAKKPEDCSGGCGFFVATRQSNTISGGLSGAALGAGVGALAGAFWRPERWERVPGLAKSAHVHVFGRRGELGLALGTRF